MANMYYQSISKKQAGVIWMANKNGFIKISDLKIKYIYNHFVDLKGFNNDNNYQAILDEIRGCVQAIFDKDYKKAQEYVDGAFTRLCAGYDSKEIKAIKEAA